jgi:multicomponent Na+:H+ antiporter subunit E
MRNFGTWLARAALIAAAWWAMAEGKTDDLWLSAVSIAAATWLSVHLVPRWKWRPGLRSLLLFPPFFLWQSLVSGTGVALRAIHPRLSIRPGFLHYSLRLPRNGAARVFMTACLSLLPGTVSARLDGDRLLVHLLDCRQPNEARIRRLEDHVALLFGAGDERAAA